MMNYTEFLESKERLYGEHGFKNQLPFNKYLFDFQEFVVDLSLQKGKFAIFSECGTGKTLMQLDWAYQIHKHTGKEVLILTPLGVAGQTIDEAEKFGIDVCRISNLTAPIHISNYEQIDNIDCSKYGGIVLDESSILKNFEGKTKNKLVSIFNNTPFKLCCTATPSPNDFTELGNHAEFLNICRRTEMLSRYFMHDGGETSKWYLKGHAVDSFWRWVSAWGIMLGNPSDIGFDGSSFILPSIYYHNHLITTDKRNNGKLFNDVSINATNFNSELRATKIQRLNRAIELSQNSNENCIIWIKQNEEADYLKKNIPDAVEVRGNEPTEIKEEKLLGFAKNKFRVLITKGKIGRYGLNYQNCHKEIFASPDFSFETVYQCIRRVYRFGQTNPVNIHLITTDTMQNVLQIIKNKEDQFQQMREQFKKIFNHDRKFQAA